VALATAADIRSGIRIRRGFIGSLYNPSVYGIQQSG
jgi:hypothetical protein